MSETNPHVSDQLSDYLAARLDETQSAAVETHLQGCDECRQRLQSLAQANDSSAVTPSAEEPPAAAEAGTVTTPELETPPADLPPSEPPKKRSLFSSSKSAALLGFSLMLLGMGLGYLWVFRPWQAPQPRVIEQPAPLPAPPAPPPPPVPQAPPTPPAAPTPPAVQAPAKLPPVAKPMPAPAKTTPAPAKPAAANAVTPYPKLPAAPKPETAPPPVNTEEILKLSADAEKASGKAPVKSIGDVRLVPKGNPFSSGELPEWKGTASGIKQMRTVAIETALEWTELWRAHTRSQTAPPKIDFDEYMIVGVYAGQKPSGGYTVELLNTEETYPPAMIVYYREVHTASSSATPTQPFHLWVVPHSTLPVKFKRQ